MVFNFKLLCKYGILEIDSDDAVSSITNLRGCSKSEAKEYLSSGVICLEGTIRPTAGFEFYDDDNNLIKCDGNIPLPTKEFVIVGRR